MTQWDRITTDPYIMNGQPCVRGMRLTVRRVPEALTVYPDWDELIREYPELEPEDIRQCLADAMHVGEIGLQRARVGRVSAA